MTAVDAEFARWLKEGVSFATADDAAIAGIWAELARSTEVVSPLALKAGAVAEAGRQIAFLGGGCLVIDVHLVDGLLHDRIGRPVTIRGDRLGYEAGATVFVIGAEEQATTKQTLLTVIRKLA